MTRRLYPLIIGPIVRGPSDGRAAMIEHWSMATCVEKIGFALERIICGPNGRQGRDALVDHYTATDIDVIVCDSEAEFASTCERLWPCPRTKRLREATTATPEKEVRL